MHYASDMAFVYLIDLNYTNRNAFRDAAINSLVSANSMYNHANLNRGDGLTLSSAVIHMSLVYDMLYSQLSSAQQQDAATKIKDLVDELLNDYYDSSFNQIQTLYGNNHLMYRAAAIGIGVIAIKGDFLNASTVFTQAAAQNYINKVSPWLDLLDKNMFASDGGGFEGADYGLFGLQPIVAYYEILRRDGGTDYFPNSNLKKAHEWITMELIPTDARHSTINNNLFDINNINASFHFVDFFPAYPDAGSRLVHVFAALGGIYQADATAGVATWLFEHQWGILNSYRISQPDPNSNHNYRMYNYLGSTSIMVIKYYANNANHPNNLASMPKSKFFLGRGLIVRDGYADDGTLFTFETNFNYNQETGKTCWRWDENDNNSFTFFAFDRRWVIDSGKQTIYSDEEGAFHSTVLVDDQDPPLGPDTKQQVINWYDYHQSNGLYYITSDITDSWTKRVYPDVNPTSDFSGNGQIETCVTPCPFPSFQKSRRHTQAILKEGDLPPYVIVYDDISQSTNNRKYTFLLHTGPGNSVGSFNATTKKVTITSTGKIMDVYYYSLPLSNDFSTSPCTTSTDGTHTRLNYAVSNVTNPHFQVVLVPSNNTTSPLSNLTFTNLNNQGSVATIDFASTTTPRKDYSLFAYQKSLNSGGFALEGYAEPSYNGVSGVMGYSRKNKTTDETIDIFMSRGSYLKMDNRDLIQISGKTARVILNDNEINVYKVSGSGRYSYKVYGVSVSQFKIYDVSQSFQAFNKYNYVKSTNVISNYSSTVTGTHTARIDWYCAEAHDMVVYYWLNSDPTSISQQTFLGRSAGNNNVTITVPGSPYTYSFRLEGKMTSDKFIDLTSSFGLFKLAFSDEPKEAALARDYLYKNTPNPFNPTTKIDYSLEKDTNVSIKIFNIFGETVRVLFTGVQTAGHHQLTFNASDLSSGIYFCVMETPRFRDVIKLNLIK